MENIQKTLALKEKPNSEKRVVIYYYKGPGQSAMSAAGMEVVPSLYNLLKKMKEEGYRVEDLPANSKELEKMIMAEGAVFGTYANGVMDRFLKESHPLLISKRGVRKLGETGFTTGKICRGGSCFRGVSRGIHEYCRW